LTFLKKQSKRGLVAAPFLFAKQKISGRKCFLQKQVDKSAVTVYNVFPQKNMCKKHLQPWLHIMRIMWNPGRIRAARLRYPLKKTKIVANAIKGLVNYHEK